MRLAATYGDGWVTSPRATDGDATLDGWFTAAAGLVERFDDASGVVGADRTVTEPVTRYLALDAAPVYCLGSADLFEECLGRAAALGFTDVIAPWPRADGVYAGDEAVVREVASRLAKQ